MAAAPTAPEIKTGQLIARPEGGPVAVPGFADTQRRVQELRQFRAQNGAAETLGRLAATERGVYSSRNSERLINRFGGGRAELVNNRSTLGAGASAEQQGNHAEASALIRRVTTVQNYMDILHSPNADEALKTLIAEGRADSTATVASLRQSATESLLKLPGMDDLLKDFGDLTPEQKMDIIETGLLKDPALRTKIAQEMTKINQSANDLLPLPDDTPGIAAQKLRQTEATRDSQVRSIVDALTRSGVTNVTAEDVAQIVGNSRSLEDATTLLGAKVAGLSAEETQAAFTYDRMVTRKMQLVSEMARLHQSGDYDGEDAARQEVDNLNDQLRNTQEAEVGRDASVKIEAALSPRWNNDIQQALASTTAVNSAEAAVLKAVRTGNEVADRKSEKLINDRNGKEADLIADLDGVLGRSVRDVLIDRNREFGELTVKETAQRAAEADKEGRREVGKAIRAVSEAKRNRWIEYDPKTRKREVHRDTIGQDLRYAIYNGEEGVQQMVLREVSGATKLYYIDDAGAKVEVGPSDWSVINIVQLDEDSKKIFDEVYKKEGEGFKDKLFSDYTNARNLWDTVGVLGAGGELNLKGHEWKLMQKHFGTKVEAALINNKEAARQLAAWKEKGYVPEFKLKWLLYALLLVGGLAGVAIAGPIAAPVAAAGAAQLGRNAQDIAATNAA